MFRALFHIHSLTLRTGLGLFVLFLLPWTAHAQTVWTGASSGIWHDPSNWTLGVPSNTVDALIPSLTSIPNMPEISGVPGSCRSFTLVTGTSLTLNAVLEVHGAATFNGTVTGVERIRLLGPGTIGGTAVLPDVEVSTTGLVQFNSVTINGDLLVLSGRVRPQLSSTCTILGNAEFRGGIVETPGGNSVFDIRGSTTFSGASCTLAPNFRCGGDFTVDAGFSPLNTSQVILDGTANTRIFSTDPTNMARFSSLIIRNGRRAAGQNLIIDADQISIDAGGEFSTASFAVDWPGGNFPIHGRLAVESQGNLRLLSTSSVHILPGGTLSLSGSPGAPATVSAKGVAGFGLRVDGLIEARDFVIEKAGVDGLQITSQAQIAPAPLDIRGGEFINFAPLPNSTLFSVERPTPTLFEYLNFHGAGVGLSNMRVLSGARVRCVNWSGLLAGPAFENDPNDLLLWMPPENPTLTFTGFVGGAERTLITLVINEDRDAEFYEFARSTSPSGPYVPMTQRPAAGDGAAYELSDDGLTPGVVYHYQIVAILEFGFRTVIATGSATPFGAATPAIRRVTPGSAIPDINAALAGADPSFVVILVDPGVYPGFVIDNTAPLRVVVLPAQPGTVNIDTTVTPLVVNNRADPTITEICGLHIMGSPQNAAIQVNNGDGTVIFDQVNIIVGASIGMSVLNAGAVVFQDGSISAPNSLLVQNFGRAQVTRSTAGILAAVDHSTLITCENNVLALNIGTNSTHQAVQGSQPRLVVPHAISVGAAFDIAMEGDPFETWYLGLSGAPRWSLLTSPSVDLNLLLDPEMGAHLFDIGNFDVMGRATRRILSPPIPAILGMAPAFQFISVVATEQTFRFSNVRTAVVVP